MSSVYDPETTLLVNSSTDATPIVVETTTAHGLIGGEELAIKGHLVNLAANGLQTVGTVIDATHFELAGTTGSGAGAGGATGNVLPWTGAKITEPSDGDGPHIKAADVNSALEGLSQDVAFIRSLNMLKVVEYTATGPFSDTVPDGASYALVQLWGGGGSGGGGAGSGTGTANAASGAGGGAGSLEVVRGLDVVPGTEVSGVVGAGGAGVAGGAAGGHNGANGSPGGDSSYTHGPTTITGRGAGGGCAGIYDASATTETLSPGGNCLSSSGAAFVFATGGFIPQSQFVLLFCRGISDGGYSANDTAVGQGRNSAGNPSPSFPGGAAGGNGAPDTGRLGGSGGGGGGGGPGGAGGAGGDGHAGINGNSVCAGSPGLGPVANSGAGSGGGGGGGASNNGTGSVGGASVDAGSGKVRVTYFGAAKKS